MASDLDIAALRKLHGEAVANKGGDFEVDTDEAFRIAFMEHASALLDAAEERDRLVTNDRMIMGRISGYDECPEDPVAAVMHVAGCFDHMTGIAAMVASDRDRLRAQRDALLTAAEAICDYDDEVEASGAQCPTAYQPLRADLLRSVMSAKGARNG